MISSFRRFQGFAWLLWVLGGAVSVAAVQLTPADLASQPARTSVIQLQEFRQAFRPEYTGYVAAGWMYIPLPSQTQLRTEWGTHEGFAFRQRFAAWLSNPLDNSSLRMGLLWWIERQGWDHEDFIAWPAYGRFGRVQSIQTAGATLSDSSRHWGVAGGVQYYSAEYIGQSQEPAQDSLSWWGHGVYGPVALQALYNGIDYRLWRLSLDLQGRALRGGPSSGWKTYLPDLDLLVRDRGHKRHEINATWEQNLYQQKIYAQAAWRGHYASGNSIESAGIPWLALHFYPDASHLVRLDATCLREAGETVFGGGLTLPFLRVAYNHADDFRDFFGVRGLWVVEFQLAVGSSTASFFGLGAPQRAPSESLVHKGGESLERDVGGQGSSDEPAAPGGLK